MFGSYGQGNHTVSSDVDLLVLNKGHRREEAFAIAKKILGIPLLEPHLYSEDEYEKSKGMIDRMIVGGVILFSGNQHS